MVVLDTEMARVVSVGRGNCLSASLASTQCKKRLCDGRSRKGTTHVPSWNKVVH